MNARGCVVFEYQPYTKEMQVAKRKQPSRSTRGRINKSEYNEAAKRHGYHCTLCGRTDVLEAHHVRFRSDGGRGRFRNISFLCPEHHRGKNSPHQSDSVRAFLKDMHKEKYGKWYWSDEHDLFKAGLIPNATKDIFEKFMQEEEERTRKKILQREKEWPEE